MSSPYSGASPAGTPQAYAEPTQNYAADYSQGSHSGAMGTPMTDSGHPDVEGVSVGALIGEVAKDMSTLMRQELELAKVELKAEAKKAGTGAGMFGAAAFAGYMVLMFLSFALWWALENVMDAGLAALIVAILWGVVAAVTGLMGKKKFQQVNPKPERTVETLQQVPGALKPN
ncbi:phage holin family protein [Blastococcus sp. TBT05-19]|uniref:phage holin family protein n=1 Tax=Blastococcus sp. TBT05-19 TaxID=2250581 RepID=UPI000DE9F895|nr:phage holin family protein [Blastococcus sp. TBT05-19]RBY94545.1 phage holin family protein [Blastococcus sp. TBT05-19]